MPVEGDGNTSPASLELQGAVSELEKAKGYDTVIAAIHKCKNICGGFPFILLRLTLDLTWPIMSWPRWGTDTEQSE